MLTCPSPPMTTFPPLRTIRMVVARHPGRRAAVSSVIGAPSSTFGKRGMYGRARSRARAEIIAVRRGGRSADYLSIERVEPDRIRPSPPPRAVDDDDAEPFNRRRFGPSPLRDLGELDRRVGEASTYAAERGRGAGHQRDGVDRRALDPRFRSGD